MACGSSAHRSGLEPPFPTAHRLAIALLLLVIGIAGPAVASDRRPVESLLERRHDRVVLQEHDLSCGAATLATVLRYQHGLALDERDIAIEMLGRTEYALDPTRIRHQEGFSLLDLKRFVERRGLVGEGYGRLTFDDLLELAPAIVPVSFDGFDHFVVFRGAAADRVLIADPAWGNRIVTRSAFESSWNDLIEFGHVAFVVRSTEPAGEIPADALLATPNDFPLLR